VKGALIPMKRKRIFYFLAVFQAFLFPSLTFAQIPPRADHVFVIIMENKGYREIVDGKDAPYFNSLAGGRLTNDWSLAHPSLPNYVAMMGAWPPLPVSDDPRIRIQGDSFPEEMLLHGHSVGAYMQGLPRAGFGGAKSPRLFVRYVLKHDPFLLFSRLRKGPVRRTVVPLSRLPEDLARGQVPEFALVVPDLCHDMHGAFTCHFHNRHELVRAGDRFLAHWIPLIEESSLFRKDHVWVFVLWDESGYDAKGEASRAPRPNIARIHAGGRIPFLWIDSTDPHPWRSRCFANHYSLLETLTTNFGLPELAPPGERVPLPVKGQPCPGL